MVDNLSNQLQCGHCNNISKMDIIGVVSDTKEEEQSEGNVYGPPIESGTIYNLLRCPNCRKTNIVSFYWASYMEEYEEFSIEYELIYPQNQTIPVGLPEKILSAYTAAEKIKTIDVNAYVILLRRLLELVCKDRAAEGKTLALMLKDLANKNEIPEKLVKVAYGLKDFGNIGAHADTGELSEKEIPIVKALCSAILEYIYSAPYLADLAEKKLKSIKNK